MKFYKAKNSVVGEGVEATVVYHKDNGDELICVRDGFDAFEEQNSEAKEITTEETDKLLEKAEVLIAVPTKAELRTDNQLTPEDIQAEIANEETPTSDISVINEKDEEGKPVQKLTYFEKREIKSVDDFIAAQDEQQKEIVHEPVAETPEPSTDTEEKL
jgi:hypothetical protein